MRDEIEPVAGNWYTHGDKGQTFQVVAVDEDRDVIEIQYFDGDLEQVDSDAWYEMDLELAEPPEDERGPLDDDSTDDRRFSERAITDREYDDEDEDEDEDDDDWGERDSYDE